MAQFVSSAIIFFCLRKTCEAIHYKNESKGQQNTYADCHLSTAQLLPLSEEFMGNQGTVNCAKFGRTTGQLIATGAKGCRLPRHSISSVSGGHDRKVNIWRVGCPSVVAVCVSILKFLCHCHASPSNSTATPRQSKV